MKNRKLTQEYVQKLFDYNPETGILIWKVTLSSKARIGDEAGWLNCDGYRLIGIDKKRYRASRIIWLHVYGYMPEYVIDHINRNTSDNRLINLREASMVCNARNSGNGKNNTSGVKGVFRFDRTNKWQAQIMINKKNYHLGYYKDFDNAVCARLAAEQCIGWSGCESNSPAYQYVKNNILKDK